MRNTNTALYREITGKKIAIQSFDFVYVLKDISGILQIVYQCCLVNLSTLKSSDDLPQPIQIRVIHDIIHDKLRHTAAACQIRTVRLLLHWRAAWNSLLADLRTVPDITDFKNKWKTHLFNEILAFIRRLYEFSSYLISIFHYSPAACYCSQSYSETRLIVMHKCSYNSFIIDKEYHTP